MATLPSNKQIAIFIGPCCSNAHALYLDHLVASGVIATVVAVIDENHKMYEQFKKELEASELSYSNGLNQLADTVAAEEFERINKWAAIRNAELGELKEQTLGKVQEASSDDCGENEHCVKEAVQETTIRLEPLPHYILEVPAADRAQATKKYYQAEAIRIQTELDIARHKYHMNAIVAEREADARLTKLEGQVTTLASQLSAMAAIAKHL